MGPWPIRTKRGHTSGCASMLVLQLIPFTCTPINGMSCITMHSCSYEMFPMLPTNAMQIPGSMITTSTHIVICCSPQVTAWSRRRFHNNAISLKNSGTLESFCWKQNKAEHHQLQEKAIFSVLLPTYIKT